jgi:glycosyltransferase involved in cell wall biosynthesis
MTPPSLAECATPQAIVVIPAFDEAATIGAIVEETRSQGHAVIVVNDASQDATGMIARGAGAAVLDLPCRLGAWGATQAGMRLALRSSSHATIVTIDGDGQHPPGNILDLTAPISRGAADIVIGSCPARGSAARHVAWWIFKAISGLEIGDLTSGFRAYSRYAARAMVGAEATLADYQDLGILLLARRKALRVREVPVRMGQRAVGKSHIFSSWLKVTRYMMYTFTIACTRR